MSEHLDTRDVDGGKAPLTLHKREHDFALTVGVDHYPKFHSLQGAVNDAMEFHAWVCHSDGGAVDPARARLVTSTPAPATPVQDQIDDQLVDLMRAADALEGGRRLYFYFSGHGAMSFSQRGDVALLLANWAAHLEKRALSAQRYSGELEGAGLFEELVIFLDCCRTPARRAAGVEPKITFEATSVRCSTHTFVAYATEAERPAFERPHGGLWQGLFTRHLLAILRGHPGWIDANDLAGKLNLALQAEGAGQQCHVINGLVPGARFRTQGVLPRLCVTFGTERGHVNLFDGCQKKIAECDPGSEPWVISLKAGLYKLEADGASLVIDHGHAEVTHVQF